MLKMEKRVLLTENNKLKATGRGVVAVSEVEREIEELWTELNWLKKNKGLEYEKSRKKMMKTYILLVIF